jgi:hypothetical protein
MSTTSSTSSGQVRARPGGWVSASSFQVSALGEARDRTGSRVCRSLAASRPVAAHLLRFSNPRNHRPTPGTATHLAPELLRAGTKISTAADVYAFGILLWECYTAKRAFAGACVRAGVGGRRTSAAGEPAGFGSLHAPSLAAWCFAPTTPVLSRPRRQPSLAIRSKPTTAGLPRATVIRALQNNSRPTFPSAAPTALAELAAACWASSPADRPNFAEVGSRLQRLADSLGN